MLGFLKPLTRRRFLVTAGAAAAGAGLYAWKVELHWLQVVEHTMPVAGLPSPWHGRRVVQLSDLHVGNRVDPDYLRAVVRGVADLDPDLTVVTGDFTTAPGEVSLDDIARLLDELRPGHLGTLAVHGNHDYGYLYRDYRGADRLAGLCREAGVCVLRNEVRDLDGLQIVGIDDLWGVNFEPRRALAQVDKSRPCLFLCHNPDVADLPIWEGHSGWMLSGHTHGGQCKPPFLPPPMLPVKNRNYVAGEYDVGPGRRLYINRGVGHLVPVRFNARPEVTVHTLVPA